MTALPTDYQNFISASRYARFRDDVGRRETWDETVTRYFDFFEEHLLDKHDYQVPADLRAELWTAVRNLEVMPSMRALMTAGPALKRENLAGFNCLGAHTLILTKEFGYTAIGELQDQWVHVLDGNAQWQRVQIRSFGVQEVHMVTVTTAGHGRIEVVASSGHDWVGRDGVRVKTRDMTRKFRVPTVYPKKISADWNEDYFLGVIHGLVYGDGSTAFKFSSGKDKRRLSGLKRVRHYWLTACKDYEELKPYFQNPFFQCHAADPRTDEKDGYTTFGRFVIPSNIADAIEMKRLPATDESADYLIGFLRGWMCADGHFGSKQASIAVGVDEKEWIKRVYAPMGYRFQGEYKFPDETNYGKRNKELWKLTIDRRSLSPEDYLVPRMRDTHAELRAADWKAQAGPVIGQQEVFCCEVPTTHSFVIQNGVLTGNCAYLPIDRPKAFAEALYVLMCGTGVGFSVERQVIKKLPEVPSEFQFGAVIAVGDSKQGWAEAFLCLVNALYGGVIPSFDFSQVRPAGARLKVFGGRASGPEPLRSLFEFTIKTFKGAAGRRLNSLECHEIVTKTGEIVVVGGVRRSAEISLSNLSDQRMRDAKSGNWWETKPHLALSNNSVAYTEKPEVGAFMQEWLALYHSKSGERGIFNRDGAIKKMLRIGRREHHFEFGVNPCAEIVLRPRGLCNLTEAVLRPNDTHADLVRKVRLASILGTWQSTLTSYNFVDAEWEVNATEERLLGVSLTGIYDHKLMRGDMGLDKLARALEGLKGQVIAENRLTAREIGITPSVATTTVKPSGTVSQLVNSSSGIHQAHAEYYIRRVRGDAKDPITKFMIAAGIPNEPDVTKPNDMVVFSFPMAMPGTVTRDQVTAIKHLELVKCYNTHWSEHAVSCTISVRENEWPAVGGWVFDNFDDLAGLSFLPHFEGDSTYAQMPYETITREKYEAMSAAMPKNIQWDDLRHFEAGEDTVTATREFACVGNTCEIVDAATPLARQ